MSRVPFKQLRLLQLSISVTFPSNYSSSLHIYVLDAEQVHACLSCQVASLTVRPPTRLVGSTSCPSWIAAMQQEGQQPQQQTASAHAPSTSSLHVATKSCSDCKSGKTGWLSSSSSTLAVCLQQAMQLLLAQSSTVIDPSAG